MQKSLLPYQILIYCCLFSIRSAVIFEVVATTEVFLSINQRFSFLFFFFSMKIHCIWTESYAKHVQLLMSQCSIFTQEMKQSLKHISSYCPFCSRIITMRKRRKTAFSPAGNRIPVSRVTGGNIHHYTFFFLYFWRSQGRSAVP